MMPANLLAELADHLPEEQIDQLLCGQQFRLERIVSTGQATPAGQWYDQSQDEWVLLVRGSAELRIEGRAETIHLCPGDYLLLPAHCRHRVEWTDPDQTTVWLAIHYIASVGPG